MTQEEKKAILNFVGQVANKEYSEAHKALQGAVEEKLKSKIRASEA